MSIRAVLVIVCICTLNLFATNNNSEASLSHALYLANLYNWVAAGPEFTAAKEQFTRVGDERNALYAELGEIRATIDRRNLLRTSADLQLDLDHKRFLQTDKQLRLFCLIIKGDLDVELDSRAARSDWEQVSALAKEIGDTRWQNRALAEIGVAAFYDGDTETAGKDIATALEMATKIQDIAAEVRFTTMLGMGFLETKMYERSQPYFNHAVELAKKLPDQGYPFLVQESRVQALIGLKQYAAAQRLVDEIIEQPSVAFHPSLQAEFLTMSARVAISQGDVSRAVSDLKKAVDLCHTHGFGHLLPEPEAMLGTIYRQQGRFREAEYYASAASDATQASGYTWAVPERLQLLAEIQVNEGRYMEADRTFDRAQAFIDSAVANSPSVLQKTALIQSASQVYSEHFDLLAAKLHNAQKAYHIIEEVRGRITADLLVAGSTHSTQARKAEQSISHLQLQLMDAKSNKEVGELRNQIFTAEQARWVTPGVSILKRQAQGTIEPNRVQQTLSDSTLILEYVVAEPQSYCLVLSRSSLHTVPLAGANKLNGLVHDYLKAVNAKLSAHSESVALFNGLLRPIKEIAQSRNIVVVRDGELHSLPFDALESKEGDYIAESHVVTYAPSITTFYLLALQNDHVQSRFHSLLAVGGVPYSGSESKKTDSTRGEDKSGLTELPFSKEEVLAAESAVGGNDRMLTGSLATESTFKHDAGQGFNVIHLAVHGISDPADPDDSYLALLPDRAAGDDGLLHASEIAMMSLHTNLVVLSACDTAVGTLQGEEGISTISKSFLLAGASGVVSTLWSVDDTSSLFLMKRFYSHLGNGETPGTALAGAKRDMLHTFGKVRRSILLGRFHF